MKGAEQDAGRQEQNDDDEEEEDDLHSLYVVRHADEKRKRPRLDVEALERAGWKDDRGAIEDSYAQKEADALQKKRNVEAAKAAVARMPVVGEDREQDRPVEAAETAKHITVREVSGRRRASQSMLAPRRKDGTRLTFNERERRSRTKRGENDFNQEQKRILRQKTDGFSMGY